MYSFIYLLFVMVYVLLLDKNFFILVRVLVNGIICIFDQDFESVYVYCQSENVLELIG